MPEVGVATVRLLRRAGYEVVFPEDQTCCGQPFFNSGFRKEARQLAKQTVTILEQYEEVVLPSGSCASMIRIEYPHLLQDSPRHYYAALRLAAKSYELSQFLVQRAKWPQAIADRRPPGGLETSGATVTYHDSCHMCRNLKLRQEPRQLLQATGHTVSEMDEPDRCCGFGGLFSVRMPEVSKAITAEKLSLAKATEATTLVTADPGCLMQMRGRADDSQLRVRHIATIVEEATR
jgi:L-lactate dehydrogenase complex protein LldE